MVRRQVTAQLTAGSPQPEGWGPPRPGSHGASPGLTGTQGGWAGWAVGLVCRPQCAPLLEHLGTPFAQFLLSIVEDGLPLDTTEQLPDLCVNLLLALNLHLPGEGGAWGSCLALQGWRRTHQAQHRCPRAHPCPSSAPDQNVIMAALSKHANVKIFSEKLLLLLNRGGECPGICTGPLRSCDSPPRPCRDACWRSPEDCPEPSSPPSR